MTRAPYLYRYSGRMADELYDVASLAIYLEAKLDTTEFSKVLHLLQLTREEARQICGSFRAGTLTRHRCSNSPYLDQGQKWNLVSALRVFEWINRFRADYTLIAEILDLARILGVTAEDLQAASSRSTRFNLMTAEDWCVLLSSKITVFSDHGPCLLSALIEEHVKGESS